MHYYQFNIAKYRRKTSYLSPLEHGIYRMLIDTYYMEEGPLCADKAKLMRTHCIRTDDEIKAFELVLNDFFSLGEDGYHNDGCDEELDKIYAKSEKARKSAQKRWEKKANAMRTHSDGNANGMLPKDLTTLLPKDLTKKNTSTHVDQSVPVIFEYWKTTMGKNETTKLTDKRKRSIQARLREGYTVDQIKQAIDACRASDFHMGQNDNGTVYDDLTLICRSGDKIEFFINNIGKTAQTGVRYGQRKESLAERSDRESRQILANIEAREANQRAMAANDKPVRPQVGEPGRPGYDGERQILDGVFTVVPED